jgi:heat shock protein HtpX
MNALTKLERSAEVIPSHANPQTAHMFIVNPLSGVGGMMKWFRTHPATEDRVARLRAMSGGSAVGAGQPFISSTH